MSQGPAAPSMQMTPTGKKGSPVKKHRQLIAQRAALQMQQQKQQIAATTVTGQSLQQPPQSRGSTSYKMRRISSKARAGEHEDGEMNWHKVSQNDQELTKLFYQVPGGMKRLVQNAIQSSNKRPLPRPGDHQTQKLSMTAKKA